MATKIFNAKGAKGVTGTTGPTGATGPSGPKAVSTDAGNTATLGSDSLVYVPSPSLALASATSSGLLKKLDGNTTDFVDGSNNFQTLLPVAQPVIWSVRMRSINAVGNSNFEVDQRNVGSAVSASVSGNFWVSDRWLLSGTGTVSWAISAGQTAVNVPWPGTNTIVSRSALKLTLNTAQASVSTNTWLYLIQTLEGPVLRPLVGDVHSISLIVNSSVAPFTFPVALNDIANNNWIVYLVTVSTANTWTLLQIPNIPVWPSGGTWAVTPGSAGYTLSIGLAVGTSRATSSAGIGQWLTVGPKYSAQGAQIWTSFPTGTTFQIGYVQHEPGPYCSYPIDLSFQENLYACQRYFSKSNAYAVVNPTSGDWRQIGQFPGSTTAQGAVRMSINFPVEMAKTPTVTVYDNTTVANQIYIDGLGTPNQPCTVSNITTAGVGAATLTTNQAVAAYPAVLGQWRADTGW